MEGYYVGCQPQNSKCNCDMTIINEININVKNLIIICNNMMTKLESMEQILTREDVEYIQEYVLRANLEVANHDTKIVRILESMGANVEPMSISEDSETTGEIVTTDLTTTKDVYEVKKNIFGKEKVVKVK